MATDCIFCKIVAGTIPAKRLLDDPEVLAFADLNPQAPVHLLVIPKEHVASLAHSGQQHEPTLGRLMAAAVALAREHGLDRGYRLVVNTGRDGGQTVDHLHVHLLGGRGMGWPPG